MLLGPDPDGGFRAGLGPGEEEATRACSAEMDGRVGLQESVHGAERGPRVCPRPVPPPAGHTLACVRGMKFGAHPASSSPECCSGMFMLGPGLGEIDGICILKMTGRERSCFALCFLFLFPSCRWRGLKQQRERELWWEGAGTLPKGPLSPGTPGPCALPRHSHVPLYFLLRLLLFARAVVRSSQSE